MRRDRKEHADAGRKMRKGEVSWELTHITYFGNLLYICVVHTSGYVHLCVREGQRRRPAVLAFSSFSITLRLGLLLSLD